MSFTKDCPPSTPPTKVDPKLLPKVGSRVQSNAKYRNQLTTLHTFCGEVLALNNPLVQVQGHGWVDVHWIEGNKS